MAVIISNGNTNLSTASGFYRVESYNVGMFNNTFLSLSTTRTVAITFANAGDATGCVIGLALNGVSTSSKTLTVTLQETRTPITVTIATPGVVSYTAHGMVADDPFEFATTGALPTGITAGTTYYVSATGLTADTFQFSATVGGASINTTGTQSGVHTLWLDKASQTQTHATMTNSVTTATATGWLVPFTFTTPYTVTTAASTYRIKIANSSSGTTNHQLLTSDGTNFFYAVWCNNAVTFANNDTVICKDIVTIDQTATVRGVTGTGDSTRAPAVLICKSSTPTPSAAANFVWSNPPASAYTLTVDGLIVISAHGGMRIGTSAARIPVAQKATVTFLSTPTNGGKSGIVGCTYNGSYLGNKMHFHAYGEIPTYQRSQLTYPAAFGGTVTMTIASPCVVTKTSHNMDNGTIFRFSTTGALPTGVTAGTNYYSYSTGTNTFNLYDTYANAIAGGATGRVDTSGSQSGTHTLNTVIVTDDTTGWAISDTVFVGKQKVRGQGSTTVNTISSISGNEIILDSNLATNNRLIDGYIVRLNGYGIEFKSDSASTQITNILYGCSSCALSGTQNTLVLWTFCYTTNSNSEMTANIGDRIVEDSSHLGNTTSTLTAFVLASEGAGACTVNRVNCVRNAVCTVYKVSASSATAVTVTSNSQYSMGSYAFGITGNTITRLTFSSNEFANSAGYWTINGISPTINSNKFYGHSNTYTHRLSGVYGGSGTGNYYDNNAMGLSLEGNILGYAEIDPVFGSISSNTTDITPAGSSFIQSIIQSPTGNLTVSTASLTSLLTGSHLRFTDWNDTTNDDRGYLPTGYYQRTGTSLTDTTVRTSPGFALRLQPIDGTLPLEWPNLVSERAVPTGNIQNLTMTVSCWIYINDTAYDAGTYQYPRLNIKYDNATSTYAEATATFGSWQLLSKTFTPTTTYGQIEVWISAATDATTTGAYVYIDDFNVAYPAGTTLTLQKLDLWANATPVWPPIATVTPADSLWDSQTSSHTTTGTFGEKVGKKLLTTAKFIAVK